MVQVTRVHKRAGAQKCVVIEDGQVIRSGGMVYELDHVGGSYGVFFPHTLEALAGALGSCNGRLAPSVVMIARVDGANTVLADAMKAWVKWTSDQPTLPARVRVMGEPSVRIAPDGVARKSRPTHKSTDDEEEKEVEESEDEDEEDEGGDGEGGEGADGEDDDDDDNEEGEKEDEEKECEVGVE